MKSLFVMMFALTCVTFASCSDIRKDAYQAKDTHNLRLLYVGIIGYAQEYNSAYPPADNLAVIYEEGYVDNPELFLSPTSGGLPSDFASMTKAEQADWLNKHMDYKIIKKNFNMSADPENVMIYLPDAHYGGKSGVVLFADGSAEVLPADQLKAMIQK